VESLGDGRYRGEIPEGWDILGNVDGGVLLSIAARAAAAAAGRADPVTVTCHYLSPGRPGPVEARTEVLKAGKRFTTVRADLLDPDGRRVVSALGTFGELGDAESVHHVDGAPPDLPDPEACEVLSGGDGFPPAFMNRIDLRLHPSDAGFVHGRPTGRPRLRGWLRLLDGELVDTFGLLLAVDSFPPTIFNASLPLGWSPTVELTAHVRARPAAGWLACEFRTRFVTGGFLEVDGEVWDATGSLVAQSRQLALVPRG
jgi:acyl-CoA thioesterase